MEDPRRVDHEGVEDTEVLEEEEPLEGQQGTEDVPLEEQPEDRLPRLVPVVILQNLHLLLDVGARSSKPPEDLPRLGLPPADHQERRALGDEAHRSETREEHPHGHRRDLEPSEAQAEAHAGHESGAHHDVREHRQEAPDVRVRKLHGVNVAHDGHHALEHAAEKPVEEEEEERLGLFVNETSKRNTNAI